MDSSGSFSGNASRVGSPKWKPRSGVEPRLEVPAPAGGVSGVMVPSGVLGVWALLSLSLPAFLRIFALEGDSSSSESGIWTLVGQADLNVFGWAPALVGHPGVWPESSGLAEVEGDGPLEVLAGSGPNLVPEANRASDDAS